MARDQLSPEEKARREKFAEKMRRKRERQAAYAAAAGAHRAPKRRKVDPAIFVVDPATVVSGGAPTLGKRR